MWINQLLGDDAARVWRESARYWLRPKDIPTLVHNGSRIDVDGAVAAMITSSLEVWPQRTAISLQEVLAVMIMTRGPFRPLSEAVRGC